jgi:hypothetical protein
MAEVYDTQSPWLTMVQLTISWFYGTKAHTCSRNHTSDFKSGLEDYLSLFENGTLSNSHHFYNKKKCDHLMLDGTV